MTEPTTQIKSTSVPTLRDLLAPVFRRKRAFLLTLIGMTVGTVIATVSLSYQYQASMEILVNEERLDPVLTAESTSQNSAPPPAITDAQINSEVEILQSHDLLQKVVLANHLQDIERNKLTSRVSPKQNDSWYVSKAIDTLAKKLDVHQVTKTNLIQVNYKLSDPQLAYAVLQTLSTLYLEKHLAVHRPSGSYDFFTNQAQTYRQALQDSEARLSAFSKQTGVSAPEIQRTELAQQVVNSITALHEAQQVVAADKRRIEELQNLIKATPDRSLTQQVSASAQTLLQQLHADLLASQIKRSQLAMKYDASYPLVQQAEREIADTQSAIESATKQQYVNQTTDRDPTYELLREDIARTQADLAFRAATATAIQRTINSMQSQMVDLEQKAIQQADLSREVKTNEANYLLYVSKREQERTSDALDERRIGNVAIAIPPSLPIIPTLSPALILLIGFVLAIFVATGAAFVAEYIDPSLRTPTEVVEVLRIPVLASIPKQRA
jgi:uncharacterized protein involved in exopolysaccharide biosynthesis